MSFCTFQEASTELLKTKHLTTDRSTHLEQSCQYWSFSHGAVGCEWAKLIVHTDVAGNLYWRWKWIWLDSRSSSLLETCCVVCVVVFSTSPGETHSDWKVDTPLVIFSWPTLILTGVKQTRITNAFWLEWSLFSSAKTYSYVNYCPFIELNFFEPHVWMCDHLQPLTYIYAVWRSLLSQPTTPRKKYPDWLWQTLVLLTHTHTPPPSPESCFQTLATCQQPPHLMHTAQDGSPGGMHKRPSWESTGPSCTEMYQSDR